MQNGEYLKDVDLMPPERPQIDGQSATGTAQHVLPSWVVPSLVINIVTAALMRASTPVCPGV